MCRYGGSGWTAARIGSGGPGDSLRIWPFSACLSSDLSPGRRTGLAHRAGLIRSLSASWRDPSQICHPVTPPRPVPTLAPDPGRTRGRMTMLAETVDAVIGIGTHRDSHEVEIADPAGRPIAVMQIGNDSAGFTRLLAAIADVVPGPRVAVCIEGSRSYGIGLARALAAAGLLVLECEQPGRRQRRGKGKSDPIDAHLAVLAALRLDAGLAAGAARRRRPGGAADLAGGPPGDHRGLHRAGRAAACLAAGRGRRRPPRRPHHLVRQGPGRARRPRGPWSCQPRAGCPAGRDRPPGARARPGPAPAQGQPGPAAGHRR